MKVVKRIREQKMQKEGEMLECKINSNKNIQKTLKK